MIYMFESLNEKDRRHYAAIEARKLGHGGVAYISRLFKISAKTIQSGLDEFEKKFLKDRIRKAGGGRRSKESNEPKLMKKFEEVIDSHTAGCPVHGTRWTYLSIEEIRKKMSDKGIKVCREVVYRLLSKVDLGKRKMSKDTVMKEVEGRNEQFERIKSLKRYHLSRGHAVLSIDAKKKEYLGDFYRSGRVLADGKVACYDHDFNSFATGKIVPQDL